MPSPDAQQIIETQRQDWNRVALDWEEWDEKFDRPQPQVPDARTRDGLE